MSRVFRVQVLMSIARLVDLMAMCVSFVISFAISSGSLSWPDLQQILLIRIKIANFLLFGGYLGLCSLIFSVCGLYRSHRLSHWKRRVYEIFLASTLITIAFVVLKKLFLIAFVMQTFVPLLWFFSFCTLMLAHELMLQLLQRVRQRGRNLRNVIIIGEGRDAVALANRVSQAASLGYRVLRIIDVKEIGEDGQPAHNL